MWVLLHQSADVMIGNGSASLSWYTGCAKKTPLRSWFRSTSWGSIRKSRMPFPSMLGTQIHGSGRSIQESYTHGISREGTTATVRHSPFPLVAPRCNKVSSRVGDVPTSEETWYSGSRPIELRSNGRTANRSVSRCSECVIVGGPESRVDCDPSRP